MYSELMDFLEMKLKENNKNIASAITSRDDCAVNRCEGREQMIFEVMHFIKNKQGEK